MKHTKQFKALAITAGIIILVAGIFLPSTFGNIAPLGLTILCIVVVMWNSKHVSQ
jgi:hypothetical protein